MKLTPRTTTPIAHGSKLGRLGADFFTLFLWELVGTPYEIAMRDKVAVYHLAYNPDGKLATYEKIKP